MSGAENPKIQSGYKEFSLALHINGDLTDAPSGQHSFSLTHVDQ